MEKSIDPQIEHEIVLEQKIKPPSLYKVVLHNDDVTTMDFVVKILVDIFKKSLDEATTIMLAVHDEGAGICGLYPKEIAEFKTNKTIYLARKEGFPLQCNMEKE